MLGGLFPPHRNPHRSRSQARRTHWRKEMQWHRSARYLAVFASIVCAPGALRAQGFSVNEVGTCAVARAFAVTGAPCQDASVIFWNPGAATTLKGWSVVAGGAFIQVDSKFTQDTTFREFEGDNPLAFVPHV